MYIDCTEKDLVDKFTMMSSIDIVNYLMEEGLALKSPKDFNDIPRGVYRRKKGQDLVYYTGYGMFHAVDIYEPNQTKISWTCYDLDGDWWVQVLDGQNKSIGEGYEFKVSKTGERLD